MEDIPFGVVESARRCGEVELAAAGTIEERPKALAEEMVAEGVGEPLRDRRA